MWRLLAIALVLRVASTARADGERTPMFGVALTWASATEQRSELVGSAAEIAWWPGRLGLAVEAAARRGVVEGEPRTLALAASARLLVVDWMWPSLLDAREYVEMGVELQAIAERSWQSVDAHVDGYGFGAAIRMRGGPDRDASALIAESRLFVRIVRDREGSAMALAREAGTSTRAPRGMTVMFGLGAAWGAGNPGYLPRFRDDVESDWNE